MAGAANGASQAGRFEQALTIIQAMPENSSRVYAARQLAGGAARQGLWNALPGWIDALPGTEDRARACVAVAEVCLALPGTKATSNTAAPVSAGSVDRPIDTTQPGLYADGPWSYSFTKTNDLPGQGQLQFNGRDLPNPQPGDYLQTPWGWMQWQPQGHWFPLADKPTTGRQRPDPAH